MKICINNKISVLTFTLDNGNLKIDYCAFALSVYLFTLLNNVSKYFIIQK